MAFTSSFHSNFSHQYLLQSKNYISPCGCQRADFCFSVKSNRFRVKMVGLIGLEPMTPALSRRCSNQLSYRPVGIKAETWKVENRNEFLLSAFCFQLYERWWRLTDSNR